MANDAVELATKDVVSLTNKRFFRVFCWGSSCLVAGSLTKALISYCQPNAVLAGLGDVALTVLMAVGGTLVTAATLGYILNDKEYQSLLKRQMVDVMLSPESYRTTEQRTKIWRKISESLLQTVLPFNNRTAVDQIEKLLLDDERQYHYEGYKSEFEFNVDEENDVLNIVQVVTCSLVISLDCESPILNQWMKVGDVGSIKPDYLRLNDEDVDYRNDFKQANEDKGLYLTNIDLSTYLSDSDNSRTLKYERRTVFKQSLSLEPYYCMDLTRYSKGFTIEVKVPNGYNVEPLGFGCSNTDFPEPVEVEGKPGVLRWRFRGHSDLLLPGFSYMLLLTKLK